MIHRRLVGLLLFLLCATIWAQDASPPLPDETLARLRAELDRGGNSAYAAAVTLLSSGDPRAVRVLAERLAGPSDDLKRIILRAYLAPPVAPALAAHAEAADPAVAAVRPLLGAQGAGLQDAAVDALAALDLDPTYALAHNILVEPDPNALELKRQAIRVLRRLRTHRAIDELVAALPVQQDPAARRLVQDTLVDLTGQPQEPAEGWPTWWQANRDRSMEEIYRDRIRRQEDLVRELRNRTVQWWRRYIDLCPPEQQRQELIQAATSAAYIRQIRLEAIAMLGRLRPLPPEAIRPLTDLACGDDAEIGRAALDSLANWGESLAGEAEVIGMLLPLVASSDPPTAAKAARVLGRSRSPAALEPLLTVALDPERPSAVQAAVVEAIGWIGRNPDNRAFQALASVARRELARERAEASILVQSAVAIGALPYDGDQRAQALTMLIELLGSPNDLVRLYAVESLGRLGDPQAIGSLAEVLRRESAPPVLRAVAVALGALGEVAPADLQREAATCLQGLLVDQPDEVIEAARASLQQILASPASSPGALDLDEVAGALAAAGDWRRLASLLAPPLLADDADATTRPLLQLRATAREKVGDAAGAAGDFLALARGASSEERPGLLGRSARCHEIAGDAPGADACYAALVEAGVPAGEVRAEAVEALVAGLAPGDGAARARACLDRLLRRFGGDDPAGMLLEIAYRLEGAGDWGRLANLLLPPLLPEAGGDRALIGMRAHARYQSHDYPGAAADYGRLVDGAPRDELASLLRHQAVSLVRADRLPDADACYRHLIELGENHWDDRLDLVDRLLFAGARPDALALIDQIESTEPPPPIEIMVRLQVARYKAEHG